jgi:hypothetical protein
MTEQNEAENGDSGADGIRSAVAAALDERDSAPGETREAVDDMHRAARSDSDTTEGVTPAREVGARSDPTDGKGAEGSKGANGAAQSTPDKGLTPPGRWSASQKEMFKSLPDGATVPDRTTPGDGSGPSA